LHYTDTSNFYRVLLTPYDITVGTGKTATFAVGILQRLDAELKQCQALVLAPTRELAQQIVKVISALGDFMGLKIHACVGGTAVRDDIRTLQDGVHIVVGTPGRVYDMIQRRALRLESVKLFGTYTLYMLCFCYTCVHVVLLLCTGVWTGRNIETRLSYA
jgi:DEAD/DEAH box helicase